MRRWVPNRKVCINIWPVKPFEIVMVIKGYASTFEVNLITGFDHKCLQCGTVDSDAYMRNRVSDCGSIC